MTFSKKIVNFLRNEKQVVLFLCIETCFFVVTFLSNFFKNLVWQSIILMLVILFCTFSLYLLFKALHYLDTSYEKQIKETLLAEQINYQNQHILSIMQSEKDLMKIRKELQLAVRNYNIKTEDESRKLADCLLEVYKDRILISYCSNKVIDAVLYNKSLLMKKLHINYAITALIDENIGIEDYVLMAVLVNMLDNAIGACEQVTFGKRKVLIDLYKKSNYVIFKVENSIRTNSNIELTSGKSTKKNKENHGIGLQVIESICKKYQGSYHFKVDTKTKMITCTAILMIPGENTNE